ncbi:kinase-like domain-containing protein [Mycena capillaripes]|nr:kinase-like domain-containing protein [Mycena capillaripes]
MDIKSDPNRARRDLLDQVVAEVQSTESSRNATPVVEVIRSTQQRAPFALYGCFFGAATGTWHLPNNRQLEATVVGRSKHNTNVPHVLSEESTGEKIFPVFGPSLKSNSAASKRPGISRERPHSPLISSPLGRTERKDEITSPSGNISSGAPIRTSDDLQPLRKHESNPSFVGGIQISRDYGRIMNKVNSNEDESSGEEEIVLEVQRFQVLSLPRNTPQGRTPMGHNPKASPERTIRASPLIVSATPTLVHSPRPVKIWEQSDVHVKDSRRTQGNASSPRKPPARGHRPFEYIQSGGRSSPKTPVDLWQQPLRRSPRGWADPRPVSPTSPFTRLPWMHQGTPRRRQIVFRRRDLKECRVEKKRFMGYLQADNIHDVNLEGLITHDDQHRWPIAGGGHSDIYRGKLTLSNSRKIRVAIKMIRLPDYESAQLPAEELLKRLIREANIWSNLEHENVLPFIGVCDDVRIAPCPVLISPFCGFGHVGRYLRKDPSANRDQLVGGVASGLKFLHDNDIVHGDLKVQNVLVDKRGVPCICDFGISKILNRRGYTTLSVGTVPYMAPELFLVIGRDNTSGGIQAVVTFEDLQLLRPKREDYDLRKVSREYWLVLDRCWAFEPLSRPSIGEVLISLPISRRDNAS